jgi:hypothetical protein
MRDRETLCRSSVGDLLILSTLDNHILISNRCDVLAYSNGLGQGVGASSTNVAASAAIYSAAIASRTACRCTWAIIARGRSIPCALLDALGSRFVGHRHRGADHNDQCEKEEARELCHAEVDDAESRRIDQ